MQPSFLTLTTGLRVNIRRNPRSKRLILSIKNQQPYLSLPKYYPLQQAIEFLNKQQAWLSSRLANKYIISYDEHTLLPIFAQPHKIIYSLTHQRGITIINNSLYVAAKPGNYLIRIKTFLKLLLKTRISTLATQMSLLLNVQYRNITIREMSSRWGSCSNRGNLSFNFKLIFTDFTIIKYLVAHEVAHLREMNHSKNFWQLVAQLDDNYLQARQILKIYSQRLL